MIRALRVKKLFMTSGLVDRFEFPISYILTWYFYEWVFATNMHLKISRD